MTEGLRAAIDQGKQEIAKQAEADARRAHSRIYVERRWPLWRVRYGYENDAWFWSRSSATRYALLCADREMYQWGQAVTVTSPNGVLEMSPLKR